MSKKVHYEYGCPFADGSLYLMDTNTTDDWKEVTCRHCLRLRKYNYSKRLLNNLKSGRYLR